MRALDQMRLLALALAAVALVEVVGGLWLERRLEEAAMRRIEREARHATELGCRLLGELQPDHVVHRLSAAMPGSFVVLDAQARVLAADPAIAEAPALEPVETRCGEADFRVRATIPRSVLEQDMVPVRDELRLWGAGVLGGTAVLVSLVLRLFSRRLLETLRRALAADDRARIRPRRTGLTSSFAVLADELETTLGTLTTERDRFATVLESMEDAVLALDSDGQVTIVNSSARSLLHLPERVESRPLVEMVGIPALEELLERAARGETLTAEFDIPGGDRRVSARARRLPASRGTVTVIHDVTELRRLERVRRDFVANVSHELRTPVAILRANAETLADGALEHPEQARRFVDAIARHSQRLGQLVSDLLDISRIEAGQYRFDLEPVELRDLVERVLEASTIAARDKSTRSHDEVAGDVVVLADPQALEQVLTNLVENAVKYGTAGGNVWVRARASGDSVRVEVADDGPGIDAIHRPRIFERFYRVDAGRARESGGTGLGLAIVKHLVEAMNGRVGVEPHAPRGTVLYVTLPRAAWVELGDEPTAPEA